MSNLNQSIARRASTVAVCLAVCLAGSGPATAAKPTTGDVSPLVSAAPPGSAKRVGTLARVEAPSLPEPRVRVFYRRGTEGSESIEELLGRGVELAGGIEETINLELMDNPEDVITPEYATRHELTAANPGIIVTMRNLAGIPEKYSSLRYFVRNIGTCH